MPFETKTWQNLMKKYRKNAACSTNFTFLLRIPFALMISMHRLSRWFISLKIKKELGLWKGGNSNKSGNRNLITLLKCAHLCGAHSVCQCWYVNWFDGISRQRVRREKMNEKCPENQLKWLHIWQSSCNFTYSHTHACKHTLTQWLRTWFYGTIM